MENGKVNYTFQLLQLLILGLKQSHGSLKILAEAFIRIDEARVDVNLLVMEGLRKKLKVRREKTK